MAKILVVDDENDILKMTCIMLASVGHDVLTASNGEAARAQMNNINLIILDAVMPGMHGLDVCRVLKRNISTKSIPVIIFSALARAR